MELISGAVAIIAKLSPKALKNAAKIPISSTDKSLEIMKANKKDTPDSSSIDEQKEELKNQYCLCSIVFLPPLYYLSTS